MSGRAGGLAPIGVKKSGSGSGRTPASRDDDFGDMLEDILDKPSRKTSQNDTLDNSFDSYNSNSLASESLPSPSPAKYQPSKGRSSPTALLSAGKGATSGKAAGRGSAFFNDSVDLDSSAGNLEESQNSSPGYQPTARAPGGAGGGSSSSSSTKPASAKAYGQTDDFDYEIDVPSGKTGYSKSNDAENDDDGDGDLQLGGGFVPSIGASKPRQRRQLLSSTTGSSNSGGANTAASLDELDSMLGFRPTAAPAPAVPAGAGAASGHSHGAGGFDGAVRSLREYESSDDEAPAREEGRAPASHKGDKVRKNLSVRIDTHSDSSAGTANLDSQYSNDAPYEPTASSTPSRLLLLGGKSVAASSSPAWLGESRASGRSPNNKGSDRGGSTAAMAKANVDANSEADRTIRYLQRDAEAAQLEREAVERQLRLEIEGLKNKAARSAVGNLSEKEIADLGAAGNRQIKESSDLRKQIAQQDVELSKLRDELTLTQLKHNEEKKYAAQKHATEISDAGERKDYEISLVEKRHGEAIKALKAIHLEELASLKERNKDNAVLDQLTQQLKSASGSIRLLEEQLMSKYKGLDAAKEGQMEARERLLADMEEKARSRADGAEAETYRLKGLLMHMEHVASSIRSQGGEEKERLRQEHQRLYTLQSSLENERNAFQARMTEELSILKKKAESIEAETNKLSNERRQQTDNIAQQHRALDSDRSEFASYVMTHTKQAEATTERFKDEEMRLNRAREELMRDRAILEQRKVAATSDLQEAESLRNTVIAGRDEVAKEKVRLQQAIAELNSAAAQLSQQGETLDKQAKIIESKERSMQEAQGHLRIAQSALKKREAEVIVGMKELEARMLELGGQDRELTQRRMELVARQRELASASSKASLENNQITIVLSNENSPTGSNKPSSKPPRQAWSDETESKGSSPPYNKDRSGNSDWMNAFRERLASGQTNSRVTEKDRRVNDELLQSRKTLQAAKSTLTRTSSTRLQAERLLSDESKFLATLQGQRARAKNMTAE